jgi:hypothetical protein
VPNLQLSLNFVDFRSACWFRWSMASCKALKRCHQLGQSEPVSPKSFSSPKWTSIGLYSEAIVGVGMIVMFSARVVRRPLSVQCVDRLSSIR